MRILPTTSRTAGSMSYSTACAPARMRVVQDKALQKQRLADEGLPVPREPACADKRSLEGGAQAALE